MSHDMNHSTIRKKLICTIPSKLKHKQFQHRCRFLGPWSRAHYFPLFQHIPEAPLFLYDGRDECIVVAASFIHPHRPHIKIIGKNDVIYGTPKLHPLKLRCRFGGPHAHRLLDGHLQPQLITAYESDCPNVLQMREPLYPHMITLRRGHVHLCRVSLL